MNPEVFADRWTGTNITVHYDRPCPAAEGWTRDDGFLQSLSPVRAQGSNEVTTATMSSRLRATGSSGGGGGVEGPWGACGSGGADGGTSAAAADAVV